MPYSESCDWDVQAEKHKLSWVHNEAQIEQDQKTIKKIFVPKKHTVTKSCWLE